MENILGKKARDSVSGFSGIVTAVCQYLRGDPRCEITAINPEAGKSPAEMWLDVTRATIEGEEKA